MKKPILYCILLAVLFSATGCAGKITPNTIYSENDLTGADIGIVENSSSAVFVEGYGTVHTYASPETLLFDLKNGALDCAVMEKTTAKAAMKQVRGMKILSELIKAKLCFAVAKENPDLREDINAALAELKDSGVLKKMISSYFGGKPYQYTSPEGIDRSKGTLTLAVDGTLRPYAFTDGNGNLVGLDIDLARAVCDYLGVDLEVTVLARADLYQTVQFGKADFSLGCIYENEAAAALVDFTDSYADCTQVIIVRR